MLFDTHIHFDQLSTELQQNTLADPNITGVHAVAINLKSSQTLLALQQQCPHKIHIASGFHPEQALPTASEQNELFYWLAKYQQNLTAIGEVGLPHYLKRENPNLDYAPYFSLLERFVAFAKQSNLPLNLHIVHNDVLPTLALLKKYQIIKAHFHWFKTDEASLAQFLQTPYVASLTPDILWNPKTQQVAKILPLERLLVETDSPWQHEGLEDKAISTQLGAVVEKLAELKRLTVEKVKTQVLENSLRFYGL